MPASDTASGPGRIEKPVRVKFTGGREVVGTLQGFDALVNLVLDDTIEYLRDPTDPYRITEETRNLGLVVARGELRPSPHPLAGDGPRAPPSPKRRMWLQRAAGRPLGSPAHLERPSCRGLCCR